MCAYIDWYCNAFHLISSCICGHSFCVSNVYGWVGCGLFGRVGAWALLSCVGLVIAVAVCVSSVCLGVFLCCVVLPPCCRCMVCWVVVLVGVVLVGWASYFACACAWPCLFRLCSLDGHVPSHTNIKAPASSTKPASGHVHLSLSPSISQFPSLFFSVHVCIHIHMHACTYIYIQNAHYACTQTFLSAIARRERNRSPQPRHG
jgi:hypothetical protein